MSNKKLYFNAKDAGDLDLFAATLASFQYASVKFEVERDGDNFIIFVK